ncbi:MAG: site-specific integrase [Clostridia bacterium]|nr:site-specific integrase [Clostridia bacterium]
MAKASKLPSGNWRVQASAVVDGKKIIKSFTANTKKDAERMAAEWQTHVKMIGNDATSLTVQEAITEYINIKSNVLSSSTIIGYKRYLNNGFDDIKHLKLYQLSSVAVQKSINQYSAYLSPKTLKNYYGLFFAAVKMFYPELILSHTFPKKTNKKKRSFSRDYIAGLLKAVEGKKIEIPVLMAITLSCRASEVAGLKWTDIDFQNRTITIQRSKVISEDGFIYQEKNKNATSNRTVALPDYVFNKLTKAQTSSNSKYISTIPPNQYWHNLNRATKAAGLDDLSFHDLRHINASIMHSLNINNKVAQEIGGWSTDHILKSVYQHTFSEDRIDANNAINNYFNNLLQTPPNQPRKRYKLKKIKK